MCSVLRSGKHVQQYQQNQAANGGSLCDHQGDCLHKRQRPLPQRQLCALILYSSSSLDACIRNFVYWTFT